MKFDQSDIANLTSVLNICSLVDIDSVIISDGGLRGVNSERTCAFLANAKIPKLPEKTQLGLTKLKLLKNRLDLFKADPKLSIELKMKTNGDVTGLEIKGSNATVQFKATTPNSIKAPTAIEDTEMKSIVISKAEAQLMLNAERAMGSKKLTIKVEQNESVNIEYSDSNNEVFVINLEAKATALDKKGSFINYYFTDVFSPLLKSAISEKDEVEIIICEASARLVVDEYPLTILSPMDAD